MEMEMELDVDVELLKRETRNKFPLKRITYRSPASARLWELTEDLKLYLFLDRSRLRSSDLSILAFVQ